MIRMILVWYILSWLMVSLIDYLWSGIASLASAPWPLFAFLIVLYVEEYFRNTFIMKARYFWFGLSSVIICNAIFFALTFIFGTKRNLTLQATDFSMIDILELLKSPIITGLVVGISGEISHKIFNRNKSGEIESI